VAAGTSGHLLGAVLAAILLGPSAAVVVVTAVLLVQALLFADGGVLALGANVLNMAIVAVLGGYAVFSALERLLPGPRGFLAAAACASWWSIVAASIACAAQLAWSGLAPWRLVLPAMAGTHALIGLGEAAVTALIAAAILKVRPDLLDGRGRGARSAAPAGALAAGAAKLRVPAALAFVALLGLLVLGVPLASTRPDGLERVAEALGFAARSTAPSVPAPMADYRVPSPASAASTAWVAALVGALVVFVLAYGLAAWLVREPSGGATSGTS
jgi:cobalt/nickel transport system permease protein